MQSNFIQNRTRTPGITEEITGSRINRRSMTSVLLMDDDYLFLECLEHALGEESGDFQIVGKIATDTNDLMAVRENRPDVVIVGMHIEKDGCIETIETLCKEFPEVKIVALSTSEEGEQLIRLVRAGISAYLLRNCSVRKLAESILAVAGGDCVLAPSLTSKLMAMLREQNWEEKDRGVVFLSDREKEILQHAATGASNKEIGMKCRIREATVKTHFRNIMRKMDVKNRAEAVALATSMRILPKISPEEIHVYA